MRAGVIGFGVGEQHARTYAADPRCELVAVCDTDAEKRAAAARLFPNAEIVADPFTLLARPDIDSVSIASPDDAHYKQVIAAIDSGKHVFVEKPVCLNAVELADIRQRLQRRPELKFSSNLILRLSPRFQDIRERARSGAIGRPYYLEADYCYGRIHKIIDGWRGRIPNYSVMLGGGVHVVDLLLWITGKRVTEVTAFGNNHCTQGTSFGSDDLTVAILRFDGGQIAKVTANFGCVMPHFHRMLIYGTGGTLENDVAAVRVWKSRNPGVMPEQIETPYPGVEKGALVRNFIDAVLGTAPLAVPHDEVFYCMSICFAIDSAKAAGRAIVLERADSSLPA